MNAAEVMALSDLSKDDQEQCVYYAERAGLTAEEIAKTYYLACVSGRDPVLFFADIMLEKLEL